LFLEDQTENFSVPEGSLNFKNVNINYFLQTADLKNRTFKISVSPKDKHNWTESLKNKYGNSVILTVKMTNFIAQNDAEAPKVNSTVSYNKEIDGTYFKNNGDLNNYLKQLFSTDQSANLVDSEGNSAFKNVRVIYYEQSANLQNRSFKIYVYPKDGHTWVDSQSRNSYMLEVKISNFVIHDIKDSLTPKRSITFTSTIIGNMKTDAEFNNYLTNLFKTNQQSNLLPAVTDYKFKNVSISYVANSANLSAKSFAVNVAPSQGHAWADGSKNTITLTAICTNFVNKEKLLVTPQAFNSDIIINTQFDWSIGYYLNWSNINKFLNPNFTIGRFITNREGWYNEALNYQKALAEQSFKSFSKYNPNLEMVSYQLGNISNDEFRGLVTRYTINTEVKPKAGYFWQDGTNGSKWVPISFFSANIWNGSAWIGQTNNISDANKLIDENWNGSVPTKTWVSNKIFNTAEFDKLIKYGATNRKLNFGECRELIIKHAKAELEATFTNYYVIKMSEPEPTRSGDIYAPWKFRVTLAKTLGGADKVEFDGIVLVAK
ncbi:MAG: hypothetical protein K2J02_03355, partial [Malacoplasma sp.]|nr:hypothetical protein [Malacoplasma sp.]